MSRTLYISHPAFLDHVTPPGHPERSDRLRAIEQALEDPHFDALQRDTARQGDIETILLAHPREMIALLDQVRPREGLVQIDADTAMSPGTWEAALRAVGAACQATDAVMTGKARNAFCAIRPPGHHAEQKRAMGFCFFNNAAIAARHAQASHGAERIAIVDFDVHHGNGTQDIVWSDPSILYASTHESPLFPGTGALEEKGEHGTIVNVPLAPGSGTEAFRQAMDDIILPRVDAFEPELIVISAGFDAHVRDPLGNLNLTESDFAWITRKLMGLANRHGSGRIVSVLEGGYDLEALAGSVAAHVKALMEN